MQSLKMTGQMSAFKIISSVITLCVCLPFVRPFNNSSYGTISYLNVSIEQPPSCQLHFFDPLFEKEFLTINENVELVKIYVEFPSYIQSPLFEFKDYYQPYIWYLSTYNHGLTLLKLPFQHDILSLTVLQKGVREVSLELRDSPEGCFGKMPFHERMETIRSLQFDSLKQDNRLSHISICNQILRSDNGHAEFKNYCCQKVTTGKIVCKDEEIGVWISLLYWMMSVLRFFFLLFCPLLLPQSMYNAAYVMSEYIVKLKAPMRLNMFISNNIESVVYYKKRLVKSDIKSWKKFCHKLEFIPIEEIVPIQVDEIQIKVKGKRIVEGNSPPSGLMQSLYDNFIRCKVKNINPFTECCESSVYGKCADKLINYNITWHTCMKIFIKLLLLLLLPIPYYIRLIIYYYFEEEIFKFRRLNAVANKLEMSFDFKRETFLQYLSPSHPIFIAAYFCYILSGFIIGFLDPSGREKIKNVIRGSLQNMRDVTYVGGVQMVTKLALNPFKTFGIIGCIIAPAYWIIVIPMGLILFLMYSIPTVYLTTAICRHVVKEFPIFKKKNNFISKKASNQFKKLTKPMQVNCTDDYFDTVPDQEVVPTTRSEQVMKLIQLVSVAVYCLAVLFASVLLISECLTLALEVAIFTMMGIIVNAGSTLKYVTMVLLVLLYMHDCYRDVYQNYVTFTKDIIEDLSDRAENIKEVASLSAEVQKNAAFQVTLPKNVVPIPTMFNNDKREPRWNVGHLSLFLDKYDTPRIPLRLFQDMCQIRTWGSPGPVYMNLLIATKKFLTIVVFLIFVLIVVLAFGNVYRVSSTNQTLATMAGGFVPLLLKNVLSSRVVKLNLKTLSFKGQMDEVLADYRQNWPMSDFIFKWGQDIEEKEEQEEEEKKEGEEKNIFTSRSGSTDTRMKFDTPSTLINIDLMENDYRSFKTSSKTSESMDQNRNNNAIDLFIDLSSGINENTWQATPTGSLNDFPINC